jgi:hypothetical protein
VGKKILYVGDLWYGSTALWRLNALRHLGFKVVQIDSSKNFFWLLLKIYNVFHKIKIGLDLNSLNSRLLKAFHSEQYDIVWIDKGLTVRPSTLRKIKQAHTGIATLISFSPDDMFNTKNQTLNYKRSIKLYDHIVTTKTHNIDEFLSVGAKNVWLVQKSFDPAIHRMIELTDDERVRFNTEVGFIGNYEKERFDSMSFIANQGIKVTIRGDAWKRIKQSNANIRIIPKAYQGLEYSKIICATKINLGFLFKGNRDKQTARSIEIPACGGFLLAERTDEHMGLFIEGKEAEFFDSNYELLDKIQFFLKNESLRNRIARAGFRRCVDGRYDNQNVLKKVLSEMGITPDY